MGMTREDAVKGLRNVADWHYGKYEQTHEEDYLNDGDFLTAVANMLKEQEGLLKSQEQRVMTAEDMWTLKFNDTVIIEQKIPSLLIPAIVRDNIKHDDALEVLQVVTASTNGTANADYEYYGKTWRCWTSRPTDEQREATPWDAQEQRDYEAAVEMAEYCEHYEPTYNADDGSM